MRNTGASHTLYTGLEAYRFDYSFFSLALVEENYKFVPVDTRGLGNYRDGDIFAH